MTYAEPLLAKSSLDELQPLQPGLLDTGRFGQHVTGSEGNGWQRLESLWEDNWHGPCGCIGPERQQTQRWHWLLPALGGWGATTSVPVGTTTTAVGREGSARGRSDSTQQTQQQPPTSSSASGASANGAGSKLSVSAYAAPQPQTPFTNAAALAPASPFSAAAREPSPPKALPVPKRPPSGHPDSTLRLVGTGNSHPLPAVPVPPAAAPAPAPVPTNTAAASAVAVPVPRTSSPKRPADSDNEPNGTVNGEDTDGMQPQLGTWAARQYRLLDPVPERGEGTNGSTSGSAGQSGPPSNSRSPSFPGSLHSGARAGSGGAGCGSAGAAGVQDAAGVRPPDSSGAAAAAALGFQGLAAGLGAEAGEGPAAVGRSIAEYAGLGASQGGTTLLELLNHHRQMELQQQQQQAGQGQQPNGQQQQQRLPPPQQQQQQQRPALDDAALAEAAWRWRFTRRWQAEQARAGEPGGVGASRTASSNGDQVEEALAYLNATNGTTTSMQIANANAMPLACRRRGGGGGGAAAAAASMSLEGSVMLGVGSQSMVGTLGAGGTLGATGEWPFLLGASGSGSFTSGPRLLGRQQSGELLAASREVASLNRRAAVVLQQQMDCEQQAERRVQESLAQGPLWVGAFINIVQIDEWGSFRFLMLKLRDQSSRTGPVLGPGGAERQRILLRGHNYGSEGQLVEETNREIMALARKHNVPFEAPTVMGGGVMEWRRDRDRHLHLHSGFVMDRALPSAAAMGFGAGAAGAAAAAATAACGRPASAADLLNLAAALARQSFPPTYKIAVLA